MIANAFYLPVYTAFPTVEAFCSLIFQIDSNTDGLVDFPEFVAATLHVHQLEEHNLLKWQQRSQTAFEKFDVDRDGFITPEELRMVSMSYFLVQVINTVVYINSSFQILQSVIFLFLD